MRMFFANAEEPESVDICIKAGAEYVLGTYAVIRRKPDYLVNPLLAAKFKTFFLDSGAFSAFTIGEQIDVNEYGRFCLANKSYVRPYANLDVIGDWKGTLVNQRRLESMGLAPMPVFHLATPAEPWGLLDDLCRRYDYFAIGGVATKNFTPSEKRVFLDKCWAIIMRRWTPARPIKVHGFGVTGQRLLEAYPWYSVDSTSWIVGRTRRLIFNWTGRHLDVLGTAKDKAESGRADVLDSEGKRRWRECDTHNVKQLLLMSRAITDIWASRGVVWSN